MEQDPKGDVIPNLTTEQLTIRGLKWPGIFLGNEAAGKLMCDVEK